MAQDEYEGGANHEYSKYASDETGLVHDPGSSSRPSAKRRMTQLGRSVWISTLRRVAFILLIEAIETIAPDARVLRAGPAQHSGVEFLSGTNGEPAKKISLRRIPVAKASPV